VKIALNARTDVGKIETGTSLSAYRRAATSNFELLRQQTSAVFGRLWGELYTGNASLCLLTHQQLSGNNYMGLAKQVRNEFFYE
jgi:hypothetical protein